MIIKNMNDLNQHFIPFKMSFTKYIQEILEIYFNLGSLWNGVLETMIRSGSVQLNNFRQVFSNFSL